METIHQQAKRVAERCSDAYSANRYYSWTEVAKALLVRNYDEFMTEAIMRSKFTRWAADTSENSYGKAPSRVLVEYLDNNPGDRMDNFEDIKEFAEELRKQYEKN